MPLYLSFFMKKVFFFFLYLSIGDVHTHVVIEELHLVELGRADGAHVGGPFLAARFSSYTHSRSNPGPDSSTSAHWHGEGHHSGAGFRDSQGHGDWDRARGARACRQPCDGAGRAVQGHVPLQQGLVRELLLADVALVGLLTSVQPHVDVEGALLGETLVADAALVGPHPCVCHHMFN